MYRKKTVILVEHETREHMKHVAKKFQTYDDLINELLKLKEKESERLTRPSTSTTGIQSPNPSRNEYNG
jgi:hypothetical protein